MSYIFTGRNALLTFRDGARTHEKREIQVYLSNADLAMVRKQELATISERGQVVSIQRGEDEGVGVYFTWDFASLNLFDKVVNFLTGKSTSAPGPNLCSAPNDYNDASWIKRNVKEPITDNGQAPDGIGIAKRLEPLTSTAAFIQYNMTYKPGLGEWVFVDWWVKAQVEHTARTDIIITYHGPPPPPPDWFMTYTAKTYWQKFTTGTYNQSARRVPETMTVKIYTDNNGMETIDIWGVTIRRDVPERKTWDLYIDLYKQGVIDRTLLIEHVQYEDCGFEEDLPGNRQILELMTHTLKPIEIIH